MRDEFLIERSGRTFVLFAGLLDEAHSRGLASIFTEIIQIPTAENGKVAICKAKVTFYSEGDEMKVFEGIGDASPENVGKMIVPHIIRMAETRAKARALRDAINVGITALEELGDPDDTPAPQASRQPRKQEPRSSESDSERTPGGATRKQAEYLIGLLIEADHEEDKVRPFVEQMSGAECSEKIKKYKPKEGAG